MEKLILHPTSTAQWHALIHDAQANSQIVLPEHLESYLVFLLIRFTSQPTLANSVIAIDFLHGFNSHTKRSCDTLQKVGDKCLLFSGLFPGLAEKRLVNARYFIHIGQSAYGTLATASHTTQPHLFSALSEQFVPLTTVLQATRTQMVDQPLIMVADQVDGLTSINKYH